MMTTFADLIIHGQDYLGLESNSRDIRAITDATLSGIRALQATSNWRYYRRVQLLNLHTIVTSATTASYTQSTRTVSWPTTLPSWFGPGSYLNASGPVVYVVQSLVVGSTTDFVLQPFSNPGEDTTFAAGSVLCKGIFDLPDDFNTLHAVGMTAASFICLWQVSSDEMADLVRRNFCTGTPVRFAVVGSIEALGKLALQLHPIPNSSGAAVSVFYTRNPRTLRIRDNRPGTVTATAGTTTVTGAATAFSQTMVGSIIRFSDNGESPTGISDTNPFAEERTIRSVNSATELIVDSALTYSYTTKKYVVSDPVDVPPYAMNFLYRLVEQQLRAIKRIDSKPEETAMLMQEQTRAMEGDNAIAINDSASPSAGIYDLTPAYIYSTRLG